MRPPLTYPTGGEYREALFTPQLCFKDPALAGGAVIMDSLGMPKPISDGQVEYTDGTPTTVDQYGRDVAAFLMWVAEPTLNARKRLGFQVMIFLIVFTGLLYFTKKRVWHAVLHDPDLDKPRVA